MATPEEETQKAIRRAQIRGEITKWQTVVTKCDALITRLQEENSNLGDFVSEWDTQYTVYAQNPVTEQVVITNVFEGVCADQIKEKLHMAVQDMENTKGSMNVLSSSVGSQITTLSNYRNGAAGKITSLQSQLASLG